MTSADLQKSPLCHFDRREKSDLQKQVILSKAKDLITNRSLTFLRDNASHWISQSLRSFEMTQLPVLICTILKA